ncbi:MAG: hypothetical protein ACRC5E_17590, partial [Shewanella sp.]
MKLAIIIAAILGLTACAATPSASVVEGELAKPPLVSAASTDARAPVAPKVVQLAGMTNEAA